MTASGYFIASRPSNRDHLGASRIRPDSPFLLDFVEYHLDDVLREHRDSRLGAWIYGPGRSVVREAGCRELRAVAVTDAHDKYLRRVGFDPPADTTGEFALAL